MDECYGWIPSIERWCLMFTSIRQMTFSLLYVKQKISNLKLTFINKDIFMSFIVWIIDYIPSMAWSNKMFILTWTYEYTWNSIIFRHQKHKSTNIKTQTKTKNQKINKQEHFLTTLNFLMTLSLCASVLV